MAEKQKPQKEVKRICRYCGGVTVGQSSAEFMHQRECPHCGVMSILMSEKTYEGYLISQKEKEEFEEKQKIQARAVHKSLSKLPVLWHDSPIGPFQEALEMGIIIPNNANYIQVGAMVKEAKAKGQKRNQYVNAGACALAIECRRPVSSRQVEYLNKLHASCETPLTVNSASRIITALVGADEEEQPEFECPYCGKKILADNTECLWCHDSLHDWVLEATFDNEGEVHITSTSGTKRTLLPISKPVSPNEIISKYEHPENKTNALLLSETSGESNSANPTPRDVKPLEKVIRWIVAIILIVVGYYVVKWLIVIAYYVIRFLFIVAYHVIHWVFS